MEARMSTSWSCVTIAVGIVALNISLPARVQQSSAPQSIDLAERLAAGKLRGVNRDATPLQGARKGVHVDEKVALGVVWIQDTDFGQGTIEIDVRGRDVVDRSYLGIAFHRKDDAAYEAVFLRPFNFRIDNPVRRQHAVQYMVLPEFGWLKLREQFPEEFENPVDQSVAPADWVPLRVVVSEAKVQIYAGTAKSPTLEVRKLGSLDRGMIGLWVGTNSDGDFSNLRITPAK
jgi:hypothetical protein